MFVTLMGRRYRLQFCRLGRQQARGTCDPPSIRGKQIRIDERLADEEQLEVILHELLHACDWRADEDHITEQAEDMARVLWRLGYRRQ